MGGSRSAARSEEAPQSPEAQRLGVRGVPGAEKGHLLSVKRLLSASKPTFVGSMDVRVGLGQGGVVAT